MQFNLDMMTKNIFLISVLILFFISCRNNTPESVTQSFVTAMNQNQFREAQKYVDASSAKIIDEVIKVVTANGEKLPENENVNFKVSRVEKENESSVLVYFTIKDNGKEEHLHVKKEGEQWKVSLEFMQEGDPHQHCSHH